MSDTDARQRVMTGKSWEDFCDALKEAGKIILRPEAPATEIDRAEGWRYLSRLTRLALESKLEFADTDFPGFYSLSHETAKIGADNPDNIYMNTTIDGKNDYRIYGTRGTVPYLSWGTKANRYTTVGTMESTGEIDTNTLVVEPDGTFEIILSQKKQGKNWLPITSDSSMVLVRQTFLDRKKEIPATMKIERIGAPKQPQPLSAEQLDAGFKEAAAFVSGTARSFADFSKWFKTKPNQWITTEQDTWWKIGGDPNIAYYHLYVELKEDEALVLESPIPECYFWNIQLDNWWWESLDYRYLPVHVNKTSARYRPDGSVRVVVAHRNPGVHNFIGMAGHSCGTMLWRWISAKSHPVPTTKVVKLSELSLD